MSDAQDLADLRTVADYQFGAGAGTALFPPDDTLDVRRSTSGRPRQVVLPNPDSDADGASDRLVSFRVDGRFTLGIAGARRLNAALDDPSYYVAVGDESEPFVREGKNAFAKFVEEADPVIRPGDDVMVVHEDDSLLGVGRAELSGEAMLDFQSGMAVKVRHGAGDGAGDLP